MFADSCLTVNIKIGTLKYDLLLLNNGKSNLETLFILQLKKIAG